MKIDRIQLNKNKFRAFTLAEMMVVMLVLSTILAAAAPLITKNVQINSASSSDTVDSGVIVLWYGRPDSLPEGWVLCNGLNGTPNMVARFVYGANSSTIVVDPSTGVSLGGGTGGTPNHNLQSAELPIHTHTHTNALASGGGHTHNISTGSTSRTHSHTQAKALALISSVSSTYDNAPFLDNSALATSSSGTHSHSISMDTYTTTHNHTITMASFGSTANYAQMPPYMVLAYIMKR